MFRVYQPYANEAVAMAACALRRTRVYVPRGMPGEVAENVRVI